MSQTLLDKKDISPKGSKSGRDSSLDLLRIIACFAVVVLHTSADQWYCDVTSSSWRVMNFYDSAVRGSVPLFFMLSGSLFLSREALPPAKALIFKYALRMLVMYLVWGAFYTMDSVGLSGLRTLGFRGFFEHMVIYPKSFLWYLPTMAGIYLLMPVLWAVAKYERGQYLGYACAMFLVFGVVFTTIKDFSSESSSLLKLISRFAYPLNEHSGYFLLGYYLSVNRPEKLKVRHYWALYIIIACTGALIGRLDALAAGVPKAVLYNNMGILSCLEALCVYLAVTGSKLSPNPKMAKALAVISRCTLFIYLFHMFTIEHLDIWFGLNTLSIPPLFSIPLISALTFIICLPLGYLLGKIPFVNKWLV